MKRFLLLRKEIKNICVHISIFGRPNFLLHTKYLSNGKPSSEGCMEENCFRGSQAMNE